MQLKQIYYFFIYVFLDYEFLWFSIYCGLGFLGTKQPIFTAVLLLDIFRRYPILLTILDSLYRPRKSIILALILFLLITYYFTLIVYLHFYMDASPTCESLMKCSVVFFD